ncbi:hypothetical protein A2957_01230 [Candidatus Roizmanbacteria bacterium RIFCSPLOWO2_01_FULL_38_11]|uniref:Nudix hydrolase domain-containing protein n=1 Tax=Candidatus Roizmanbacteria bacterium RIFCSPLOWO2_01_FULL_38_11 TaxID=1802060 RepID=A0A1F7IL18_9BACT|nr:MAG: hypothetical protein A2957_01230 [Candidatus Roizmanbacteria bacterium RIFCSPLOWO2_01_FULL_38_11]
MPLDDRKEIFVVVDSDDNIIDYRSRYECHHDKNLIHRAADIVLFNDKGNILMQKRSTRKDTFPLFYTISASGHVGKGESYEEAAYRELLEEIGIKTKLEFKGTFLSSIPRETEMAAVFVGKYDKSDFVLDEDEVESVAFFSIDEIINMIEKLTPGCINTLKYMKIL